MGSMGNKQMVGEGGNDKYAESNVWQGVREGWDNIEEGRGNGFTLVEE